MIRYNANSPEILGKKQYDVLRGFGWWCVIFGICAANLLLLVFNQVARHSSLGGQHGWLVLWLCIFFLSTVFCATYFFVLGIGNINRTHSACFTASFGKLGLCIIALIAFLAPISILSETYSIRYDDFLAIAFIFLLCFLAACFFWGILKTYKEDHIVKWFNNAEDQRPVSNPGNSEPDYIVVFQNWNPLQYYGKLWKLAGSLFAILIVTSFIAESIVHNYGGGIQEGLLILLPITAVLMVAVIVGHGLSRQKEWARMLMILLHCAIILLVTIAIYTMIAEGAFRYESWLALTLMMFLMSIGYWCYFVIRTLTSPVVKYVCLRGGHDID